MRFLTAGKRFGRLVVASQPIARGYYDYYRCVCDCGGTVTTRGLSLINGVTKSCGCLVKERITKANYKHGHAVIKGRGKPTKTWIVWRSMRQRCEDPSRSSYHRYGGRGITVCDRWQVFEHFLADMGEVPHGLTLERKNNNKGYSPDNCCWATRSEQALNRCERDRDHLGRFV